MSVSMNSYACGKSSQQGQPDLLALTPLLQTGRSCCPGPAGPCSSCHTLKQESIAARLRIPLICSVPR